MSQSDTPAAPQAPAESVHALPIGTRLAEFEVRSVLGEGGFAIVYLAYDHLLRRTVAIKEYMPATLATRTAQGRMLAREEQKAELLQTGLRSFLHEAQLLAQFDHPALIRVYRFWEENGTAYMAMQLCQGQTLRVLGKLKPELTSSQSWLMQILPPILDALELMHASNCYHRDISPDNIMVLSSGVPMLLDFGSARHVIGDQTQALTVFVKPGYAPIEQYDHVLEQGSWTDIYSLGAVLFYLITGQALVASVSRLIKDPLPKLAQQPGLNISPAFAAAIDKALSIHPEQRFHSIAEFREALEVPTFWVEMQRQSVELGALRSHAAMAAAADVSVDMPVQADVAGNYERTVALPLAAGNALRAPGAAADGANKQPPAPRPTVLAAVKQRVPRSKKKPGALPAAQAKPPKHWLYENWLPVGAGAVAVVAAVMLSAAALRPDTAPEPAGTEPGAQPAAAAVSATPGAAAEAGTLLLDIAPWGVVYINGDMKGLTPPLKELQLPPGTYAIEIRNSEGQPAHTRTIRISAGQSLTVEHDF